MAPNLDLKSSLTLRVVAVALFCFLIAAALALFGTYRDVRQLNEHVADVLVRQLQMQLSRIETSRDVAARFPDLDPVTEVLQSAGQCVQYVKSDGSIARSSCIGFNRDIGKPPDWFAALCDWIPAARADVARPISYRDRSYGTVVVTTESAADCRRNLERSVGASWSYRASHRRDLHFAVWSNQPSAASDKGYFGRPR